MNVAASVPPIPPSPALLFEPGPTGIPTPEWGVLAARAGKRAIDVIGATLGLLLLAPLMLVIALIIRLESPGPVLFRQRRLGRGGRPFKVLKFRSMIVDAERRLSALESHNESLGGVLFKMKDDPRVTRIGRFLRRTSLDELPQLFNVIRGDMSLVGPRPLQLRDCRRLLQADPVGFAHRLRVPQGLTGLWQISGRSEVDSQHMLRLDLNYVACWSLQLDLQIILQTFIVVLSHRGAW